MVCKNQFSYLHCIVVIKHIFYDSLKYIILEEQNSLHDYSPGQQQEFEMRLCIWFKVKQSAGKSNRITIWNFRSYIKSETLP